MVSHQLYLLKLSLPSSPYQLYQLCSLYLIAPRQTNTFQLLVVTDEVRSYAVFNYEKLNWISHTEAGGSADEGQGGTPAFVRNIFISVLS